MDKVELSKDLVVALMNFLLEQKLKDSIHLFLALDKEAVPQLQGDEIKLQ
jgi:hypothetical protein